MGELRMVMLQELNVQVVGFVYKFIGLVISRAGSLGISGQLFRQILSQAMNRVKEQKYAIRQGFTLLTQHMLCNISLKDFQAEYFNVAIPHKNPEVREDLCRCFKVIYASSLVYDFIADPGE